MSSRLSLTIENNASTLVLPLQFVTLVSGVTMAMEGRKHWPNAVSVRFTTSNSNIELLTEAFPGLIDIDDRRIPTGVGVGVADGSGLGNSTPWTIEPSPAHSWPFKTQPYKFQLDAFTRFRRRKLFALFAEMGTGKTKIILDIIAERARHSVLTGVLVAAWPKGVHHQWVEEQLPEHMWDDVPYVAYGWDGKRWPKWIHDATPELQILTVNIEAVNVERHRDEMMAFLQRHGDKGMMIVDESQTIKSHSAKRTKNVIKLGQLVNQRSIMTGTPIAKDLTDEWSQFNFLDPNIIGHKYLTSFRAAYCRMGGYQMKQVVGAKNVPHLNAKLAPYIFRATKIEELDLPPKVYDTVLFEMSDEQKLHQKRMKENYLTWLNSGETISMANAAVMILRLQQLACGVLVDDNGQLHRLKDNPRLDAFRALDASRTGKKVVWCRFTEDIKILMEQYSDRAVAYYGDVKDIDRRVAIAEFNDRLSGVDLFIANAATAGSGLNLQVGGCTTAIYYSNSYNSVHRWQSEDRIHRIGTIGTVTYFDLVARGSVDRNVLNNLKHKKDLSDLVLDDLRRMINDLG